MIVMFDFTGRENANCDFRRLRGPVDALSVYGSVQLVCYIYVQGSVVSVILSDHGLHQQRHQPYSV
jgi:hypothetical protein